MKNSTSAGITLTGDTSASAIHNANSKPFELPFYYSSIYKQINK